MVGKKSFIFTMDAILAFIPLFIIISVVSQMSGSSIITTQVQTKALHHTAEGVMEVAEKTGILDEIGVIYSNYTLLQSEGDPSWVNERNRLVSVIRRDLDPLIPEHMGYAIYVEGEEVYSSDSAVSTRPNKTEATTVSSASRITTGYQKAAPSRGCMSRATLIKIAGKRTSDYAYFGGFVGQGDITVQIRDIPSDAKPREIQLELMVADDFDLYINDNYCDTIYTSGEDAITSWSTTSWTCLSSIVGGDINTFTLRFKGEDLTKKYVAGGYIRVIYDTSLLKEKEVDKIRYYFPGVGKPSEGLINVYDGFYVPGNVTSINARLHFFNNYTTFLNIAGEEIAEINGSSSEQIVTLSNSNFSALDYSSISMVTFPIRFGSKVSQILQGNGTADVVLITDVSGSMNWRIGYSDSTAGEVRDCCPDGGYRAECMEDPTNPLFNSDTQRLALAKCLDKYLIDIILNTTGNRVALVHFSTNAYDSTGLGLLSDNTTLFTAIDSYTAYGGTCICCAINRAYEILNSQSNENRTKFIIVMTDGITGFTCEGAEDYWWDSGYWRGCTGTSTSGYYVCGGNPDNCGIFSPSGTGCSATGCSNTRYSWWEDPHGCTYAMNNANWSAWRAHAYLNATVYAVGFGDLASCCAANWTLTAIAQSGNGSVYISSNATELAEIYREIAERIVNLSYVAQVGVPSPGVVPSYLYPDSYIEFEYIPSELDLEYAQVEIKTQTDAFDTCNLSLFIPGKLQIKEFKVASYSGNYWTDNVSIMNSAIGGWNTVYYLPDFGNDYIPLGDPYIIDIPASLVNSNDTNYVNVMTGLSGSPSSQCLGGSRIIYTFRITAPVPYSEIREKCEPKNVSVYYDIDYDGTADGCVCVSTDVDVTPPSDCSSCTPIENLTPSKDSIDDAILRIMDNLNFYDDKNPGSYGDNPSLYDGAISNPIDIKIPPEIVVESTSMLGIPKLYEPVEIRLEVWG